MAVESMEERCRRMVAAYMDAFNARDVEALGALLDENVKLVDWEVAATGKADVLATTRKIVSGAELRIHVDRLIVDLPYAAADLTISINGQTELAVLDLFELTPEGRIASIRAFRGPERQRSA